ncbi:hypothetical protein [Vibrio vulnificus]|uniref:hypothetical protein n=1 Tax=Vibrio vulnificus TaxID=672 RepID=UPI00405888D0
MSSTRYGTNILGGIEFNEIPPPQLLLKAMERKWAEELMFKGKSRLSALRYYQSLEDEDLGDRNEGLGELSVKKHLHEASSLNEAFIWCAATSDADKATLLSLNKSYNVIIEITDPIEFVNRIHRFLGEVGKKFSFPQMGKVTYNRSTEVSIEYLQHQPWFWFCFQKSISYSHQSEYRILFSSLSTKMEGVDHIELDLGCCKDIIKILEI